MGTYYVETQAEENGRHKIHTSGCPYLPGISRRLQLGDHATCHSAIRATHRHFEEVDGCLSCAPECHKD
jgi:hypothetical protein